MSPCPWSRCPADPLRPEAARLPWGGGGTDIYEITLPAPGHSSEITEVLGGKKKKKKIGKKRKRKRQVLAGTSLIQTQVTAFLLLSVVIFCCIYRPANQPRRERFKAPTNLQRTKERYARKEKEERREKKNQHQTSTQLKITILFLDGYQVFALTVPGL